MFEIKNSKIKYYDAEDRCENEVVELANIEGMLWGITDTGTIVCRWDTKFTAKGYPVGRRGACWMSMPRSMTTNLINMLIVSITSAEHVFEIRKMVSKYVTPSLRVF